MPDNPSDPTVPCTSWKCWFQAEYPAFLLTVIVVGLLVLLHHIMHSMDVSTADESWGKETVSTVIGALLLRLTSGTSQKGHGHAPDGTVQPIAPQPIAPVTPQTVAPVAPPPVP